MNIVLAPKFLASIKDKVILLDTCVFVDTSSHEKKFRDMFAQLKENRCTLVTLDMVVCEFMKGFHSQEKIQEKKFHIYRFIDAYVETDHQIIKNIMHLINLYKEIGKGVSMVDFALGGTLKNILIL